MAAVTTYDSILNWLHDQWYVAVVIIAAGALIALPKVRDGLQIAVSPFQRKKKAFTEYKGSGETARYEEKMRSREHDVIKIHCHSHRIGVMAEYAWIEHEYPKISGERSQSLVRLDMITGDKHGEHIWFDVLAFTLSNGMTKLVYFDISDFFTSSGTATTSPAEFMAEKLRRMYGKTQKQQSA